MKLNRKQKLFCKEYVLDWNGTRAYRVAYKSCMKNSTARANASRLLTNANIQEEIDKIKNDYEKALGLSKFKVLKEHMKLAFNTLENYHDTWINKKKYDQISPEAKAGIKEIETREVNINNVIHYEVKLKLYNKIDSLREIQKMMGYNEPDKVDHSGNVNIIDDIK